MSIVPSTGKEYDTLSVIHVSSTYPPVLGGMEKVVQILAGVQSSMKIKVRVVTSRTADTADINDEFKVQRLKSFVFANTTVIPKLLTEMLNVSRGEIVHVHITQAFTPEIVWLASKIKRFHYIAHIHIDAPPSGPAGFLLKIYKPLFLRRVLHAASYVVVFTDEQKSAVHSKYGVPNDRIKVVVNGVEDKFYFDKSRSESERPKLLFVGRLGYQKNIPQLLSALKGVSGQFETVLVGSGELETELKSLAKELELKNVTFAGRKDGTELLKFYDDADIFVLSSEREGMPLVLLEAMAMGLPIVATDVTGNRDVVVNGENGLLVPFNDADAFREALLKIKSDKKLYKRMSQNARKMASLYSWGKIARQFAELYKDAS
jgi:glycosyltransferase involved in cell wall biosynthesis